MDNVFDVLKERGFLKQATHEKEIRELLGKEKINFYIGFDPTADSLHVGHFIQIIIMMHMQNFGHRPIVLVGGGTGMVGDPSGRTDMRRLLTKEAVIDNCNKFQKTFTKFLDFSDGKAIAVNNAEWLLDLNYVNFIRDIGRHFSVNRMLAADCFKQRLQTGLSFLEFNYMLMQSYDFLELYKRHNCRMQFGGDDQWSNIISGVDLVRREAGVQVFGMTFTLLTNSEGKKMGKTQKGALWLDPEKTSPYEFYQYWRNVEDVDVRNCLSLLTFLPMDEVNELGALKDSKINKAKEILAYEVTRLVHGDDEAAKAQEAARALFSGGGSLEDVPKTIMAAASFEGDGMNVVSLMTAVKLASSRSEGFRIIEQGGLVLSDMKITNPKMMITLDQFSEGKLLLKKGKKTYHLVELDDKLIV